MPRIAIVGGGIGGLAAAAFLRRAGLEATVYEQASQLTEIGAGVVVAPNAARLLRALGVLDALAAKAVRLETGLEFRRWQDGRVLSAEDLATQCERRFGEHTYTAHRADLLEALSSAVPVETVRLGMRCVALGTVGDGDTAGDDGPVTLTFANGEQAEADIVIGADGIHSTVRAALTGPAPRDVLRAVRVPRACPGRAGAGLLPPPRADPVARPWPPSGPLPGLRGPATSTWSPSPRPAITPPSRGPRPPPWRSSWRSSQGWDERLIALIRAAGTPGRWALLDRAPLSRWTKGSLTLLGDAAHPMFPFFGQGAAQAIEDAATLAGCLAANPADPAAALRRYEELRIPRTTRLQEVSHARARINHLPDGPDQRARDAGFGSVDPLAANAWIYAHDAGAPVTD